MDGPEMELNRTQKDCLDAKGVCRNCVSDPVKNGWLSLAKQGCQVKYANPLRRMLGLQPTKLTNHKSGSVSKICIACQEPFISTNGRSLGCPRCSANKRPGHQWMRCVSCGQTYLGHKATTHCYQCRGVA